jgi:G:T-mismatch repair DNA endonuclease (very short patch repair protein)
VTYSSINFSIKNVIVSKYQDSKQNTVHEVKVCVLQVTRPDFVCGEMEYLIDVVVCFWFILSACRATGNSQRF